ncbi:uncharacterized protein HD556DRAFT_948655 [Suillus plorans]|uniref:Uncharacterized protein n=1 Tax=Suillus plorans TaxID=116603 RepID=A0A9P7DD22_9AGAM|nr:uncharacterized protein HD556DRAFT_948655 [Suillus plorans]KAG1787473.1 hypothetical protein HD556DRAFT_948655 [Suillus plorans]
METFITSANYAAGVVVAAVVVLLVMLYKTSPLVGGAIPLPPGPPGRWLWCNALPAVNICHALIDLVREYGPIVSFRQGSQVIIVIGNIEAATDIMEKEGGSLVDRLWSIAAVHTHLQPKAAEIYQDMQREHAMDFILDMLNDPRSHQKHAHRMGTAFQRVQ